MPNKSMPPNPTPDHDDSSGQGLGGTNFLKGSAPKTVVSPLNALRAQHEAREAARQSSGKNQNALLYQGGLGSLLEKTPSETVFNPGAHDPNSSVYNTLGNGILGLLETDEYQKRVIEALRNNPNKWASRLLHRKIRAARMAAGYKTQKAFAEVLQCSHGAVSQWETDDSEKRTTPDMHWILRIALVTGLPAGWLIDDQFADPHEAETFRTLNLSGRWQNMPVQMPEELPEHWPKNGPKYENATVVDGLGVFLHDSNDQTDPADKRKHPRPAEIAFRGVEVNVATHHEELFDHFDRKIEDFYHADYFDGHNLVTFVHLRDKHSLWSLRRQIGDLLFVEAMLGTPLRKMILAWGASEQPPESFQKALDMGGKTKVQMAYFTRANEGSEQMLKFLRQQ